jgi:hypothetical protein
MELFRFFAIYSAKKALKRHLFYGIKKCREKTISIFNGSNAFVTELRRNMTEGCWEQPNLF